MEWPINHPIVRSINQTSAEYVKNGIRLPSIRLVYRVVMYCVQNASKEYLEWAVLYVPFVEEDMEILIWDGFIMMLSRGIRMKS